MNWHQVSTMLWLRWRLTYNQWSRGGQLNAVITLMAMIIALIVAAGGGVAGFILGLGPLANARSETTMLVWDGMVLAFLFFWMLGIVVELQRSELIDLSKLLHLPVSLWDVFVLNYLTSFFSLSLAFMVPAMLGISLGLVFAGRFLMAFLVLLVFAFFFMITAWTYCLRGWLAALMVNQRRRRTVIMIVTVTFVILAQIPNLLSNMYFGKRSNSGPPASWQERQRKQQEKKEEVLAWVKEAHAFVPVLWLPKGAQALAEGSLFTGLLCSAGMLLLGGAGLHRAYRSTLFFYRGGNSQGKTSVPSGNDSIVGVKKTLLVERQIPLVSNEVSGLALTTLRSMLRAPEVKMAMVVNVVVFLILGFSIFMGRRTDVADVLKPLIMCAAVGVTFMGLVQVLFNQFGFDRDSFRALVLIPVSRKKILAGKNLALLPFALGIFAVLFFMLLFLVHPPLSSVIGTWLQFAAAFLGMSALGNVISILVPFRIAAGTLKPTKAKATVMLGIMLVHMTFPLVLAPIIAPSILAFACDHFEWMPGGVVNIAGSLFVLILAGVVYWLTLEPLGRLLMRRERKILSVVTSEVE